jgi:peroxiredoxin
MLEKPMPFRILLLSIVLAGFAAGCQSEADPGPRLPLGTQVGERAPELQGQLAAGEGFTLADAVGRESVLVFYRSAQCGLCRVQLEQLQQNLTAYERQGARVVAVTLDDPEVSRTLAEQMNIGFSLVSVDSTTFERWQVLDRQQGMPLPASYVIDRSGVVRFRHIGRNAADRTSDAELLTVLERIRQ